VKFVRPLIRSDVGPIVFALFFSLLLFVIFHFSLKVYSVPRPKSGEGRLLPERN